MQGAQLGGENPLPIFRNQNRDRSVKFLNEFSEEQTKLVGYETGEIYLPHRWQDRYTRELTATEITTIVLENENLRATFLPELGGRLYSLFDKEKQRELLFTNPILQFANLSILNAWFSGGIEWNMGQYGHTFGTCSPVHVAKLIDEDGNEFIRIYDYERTRNFYWAIDCHLPSGAKNLRVHVRIINDRTEMTPMYWWTNIAVRETPKARVFGSTEEVVFVDQGFAGYGTGKLPYLPTVPDVDLSFPQNFPFANEYFFQNPKSMNSPWETILYEDGELFYERSTAALRYKKMFCWGNHVGGRGWQEFLSDASSADFSPYLELQAGLAPTQLHGYQMPGNSTISFTQFFGSFKKAENSELLDINWSEAQQQISNQIEKAVPTDLLDSENLRFEKLATKEPVEILFQGSGWASLEQLRRQRAGEEIPSGFRFEPFENAQIGEWIELLETGNFPDFEVTDTPKSWMVQKEWILLLENSHQNWLSSLHIGNYYFEIGKVDAATKAWKKSLEHNASPWALRNLAIAQRDAGNILPALELYEEAINKFSTKLHDAFYEEYLQLLITAERYEQLWKIYTETFSNRVPSERVDLAAAKAALQLGHYQFLEQIFTRTFAQIREGESTLVAIWFEYQAILAAQRLGVVADDQIRKQVRQSTRPPKNIDFRMIEG
jgi:tetratricopeptide (TPR) repeat protein